MKVKFPLTCRKFGNSKSSDPYELGETVQADKRICVFGCEEPLFNSHLFQIR